MIFPITGLVLERVEEGLYLGNRRAASRDARSGTFDHVLTVSRRRRPLTTVHRPIRDGADSTRVAFAAAVDAARARYRTNGSLLVHCRVGISRSTAVVATTLAAERRACSFERALRRIREVRPTASPNPALVERAERYLGEPIDDRAVRGPDVRLHLLRTARAVNRLRARLPRP